jgi:hypothetical protein
MSKTKALPFPLLADWVRPVLEQSDRPLVRYCQENLKAALLRGNSLPDKYSWQTIAGEAFQQHTKEIKNIHCWNSLFWSDWSKNCEAYSVMLYWRALEIIKPTVRAINQHDYIAAAILARSLLELTASYILNANFIHNSCAGVAQTANLMVGSQECEDFIVKAIWGRRFFDPEDAHKQVNALSHLQRLNKNHHASDLVPTYDFLCEVAHPNVVGFARFWNDQIIQLDDGSEVREMCRNASDSAQKDVLENTIWALSFGAECLVNAHEIINSGQSVLAVWLNCEAALCRA